MSRRHAKTNYVYHVCVFIFRGYCNENLKKNNLFTQHIVTQHYVHKE